MAERKLHGRPGLYRVVLRSGRHKKPKRHRPCKAFRVVLSVCESWEPEDARRVGCGDVRSELVGHSPLWVFGFLRRNAFDFPYNPMFARRRVENEIWVWDFLGILDRFESLGTPVVQVKIDVPDFAYVALRSAVRSVFQRVHPDVDVESRLIPFGELLSKIGGCDLFR